MCRKRKQVVLGLCFGWAFMLMLLIRVESRLPQVFVYNATASVPVGWYLLLPPQNVARDDMVVFTVPEDMQALAVERGWLPKGTKMLKRVGGLAGDMYSVNRSRQFYVNDVYIGQASLVDGKGQEMPDRSCGSHMVEDNCFLPVGDNPHSFDGRYYGTVPLECIKNKAMLTVIVLEIMGIAFAVWLKAGAENKTNDEDYQRYVSNREAVITELNRLEVARQEDIKPMEALSAMIMNMPQQVKCRHVTIGNFHNGDWIVMEVESGEKGAVEDYLSVLRKNQYFSGMRIEDIKDGVRVTVPMPEGFRWQ